MSFYFHGPCGIHSENTMWLWCITNCSRKTMGLLGQTVFVLKKLKIQWKEWSSALTWEFRHLFLCGLLSLLSALWKLRKIQWSKSLCWEIPQGSLGKAFLLKCEWGGNADLFSIDEGVWTKSVVPTHLIFKLTGGAAQKCKLGGKEPWTEERALIRKRGRHVSPE